MKSKFSWTALTVGSVLGAMMLSSSLQAVENTGESEENGVNDFFTNVLVNYFDEVNLLTGTVGPQDGRLDRSDCFLLAVPFGSGGRTVFRLNQAPDRQNSQTRLTLWTDRDGAQRFTDSEGIANEHRIFSVSAQRNRIFDLSPGEYIVQVTQSKKVAQAKGYTAVIQPESN